MTISPPSALVGAQHPRLLSVPPFISSAGQEAVELAATAGLVLDPWQQFVLDQSLGERSDGNWSAFEVGLIVSRQNGKGSILEARELAGLYLFGERLILHSAHEVKTALEAFQRILQLIESTPDLESRLKRVVHTNGREAIELKGGGRLKFVARSTGSGRGFSADCVILDEAFHLREAAMNAMMPTMSARENPQIWYVSTAVNANEHANGWVLTRIRERGLKGDDPSLAYFEWSADDERYNDDPEGAALDRELWAQANPGLGIRIMPEYIENEHRSMTPEGFQVERLGVGIWPTPLEQQTVFPMDAFAALTDRDHTGRALAFCVDVAPDRGSAAIAVAAERENGTQLETVHAAGGTGWIVDRCRELSEQHDAPFVIDPGSPAGSLIPALEEAGVSLILMRTRDVVQAFGMFMDGCLNGTIRHSGDAPLTEALSGAAVRELAGGGRAWSRKSISVDITPLVAATNALWGAGTTEQPTEPDIYFL